MVASGAAVLLAGWLIGATSIGGVLVVPALVGLQGLPAAQAIAASALAFAVPGLLALFWARPDTADTGALPLPALLAGVVPGALLGAVLVHQLRAPWLLGAVGALALASGLRGLRPPSVAGAATPLRLGAWSTTALGLVVGLGSGLTGTGGPVLLVPLLLALRQPLLSCVLAGQLVQLPVALAAALGHWQAGSLDLRLAALLGALLLVGSMAGQWSGRRLATHHLQRGVSLLLIAAGAWLAAQAFTGIP